MEDKRREPGLDLLRALGLLAVVSFHFFLYNGFYARPQTGAVHGRSGRGSDADHKL